MCIPIYFHPTEMKRFEAYLKFYLNSKLEVVNITGEGVPLIIELNRPEDTYINFGSLMIGTTVSKAVTVVNQSKCSISACFGTFNELICLPKPKNILDVQYFVRCEDQATEKSEPADARIK